jgi:hypothetical protein
MASDLAIALVLSFVATGSGLGDVLSTVRLPTARIGDPVHPTPLVDALLDLGCLLGHYISSR